MTSSDSDSRRESAHRRVGDPQPRRQILNRPAPQLERLQQQIQQADIGIVRRKNQEIEDVAAERQPAGRSPIGSATTRFASAIRPASRIGRRRSQRSDTNTLAMMTHAHRGNEAEPNLQMRRPRRGFSRSPIPAPRRFPNPDRLRQTCPSSRTSRSAGKCSRRPTRAAPRTSRSTGPSIRLLAAPAPSSGSSTAAPVAA